MSVARIFHFPGGVVVNVINGNVTVRGATRVTMIVELPSGIPEFGSVAHIDIPGTDKRATLIATSKQRRKRTRK